MVAVGAALGIMVTSAMTGWQILLAITASGYLLRNNGFRDESYSVWSLTVYIGVKLP